MSTILTTENSGVFTISLNRPDAFNSFTPDMLHALSAALNEADHSKTANVIVLEGNGRGFSAGVDLKILQGIEPAAGRIGDVFDTIANSVTAAIRNHRLPVIAKVHGACFTGALEIALSCDFIIAEAKTKFGDTHAKWGLRPTWGMAQNLARAVGVRRARQLSFSAAVFSGTQAHAWGLVNEVAADADALTERVAQLAQEISSGSTAAIEAYKKLYQLHEECHPLESALAAENELQFPNISDTKDRLGNFGT
ncbi:enoyl-CoA hydratase/isomerase family protein [Arenicella xantha]|uniref:Enoyl-CoA hydratase/carnithine racemase n=1 Tax=Arenicella xantha TaxID=644221 RepID=A0A395JPN4_9GAMM|nr:enoyl-CoA hydratase/isomerase family protein [Arenicella xantha]RBP53610.1 enoyl-CoA hydratase/carnithine racemase [Arenicella xantha]